MTTFYENKKEALVRVSRVMRLLGLITSQNRIFLLERIHAGGYGEYFYDK